ncbi:MAG: ABC transporter permease subunit [Pseudomonadota bacterium]
MTTLAAGRRHRTVPWSILGPMLVLALWEAGIQASQQTYVIAAPSTILVYIAENAGLLSRALGATLVNAAAGFILGNLAAILLAAVAIAVPRAEAVIRGLALLVFCLPVVATGPILRVFFGPGDWPQIILAALAVYYTTLIPLLVGLRAVPSGWLDLVSSFGRGRWASLVYIRSAASVPYLVAGLQIAAPAAFLGAMVGEFTGAERGMGVLTIRSMRAMDIEMTWSLAVIATAVSVMSFVAIGRIGRRFMSEPPPTLLATPVLGGDRALYTFLVPVVVGIVAVVLWWSALKLLHLNPFFAKGPVEVFDALLLASDAARTRHTLGTALSETAVYLVPGYLAGLFVGAALAVALVQLPSIAGTAIPLAVALRSVPIITTAPLVVLLLGRGATGTITLVAIMVFFPTFLACLHGLRQAPGQIVDVMRSYAASSQDLLVRVRIPAMLPAFFAAARINVPASVLAVTVVEWLATGNGIGSLMALSASLSDYDMLWSSVVLVAALSVVGYGAVGLVERRVLAVYAPEQLR